MIKSFRMKHNLTQAELAKLSGVSRQRISDFENGKIGKGTPKSRQLDNFMIEYNSRCEKIEKYKKVIDFLTKPFGRLFR